MIGSDAVELTDTDSDPDTITVILSGPCPAAFVTRAACFWHWIEVIIALIGLLTVWLVRKKKLYVKLIFAAVFCAGIVLAYLAGSCPIDLIVLIAGSVLIAAANIISAVRAHKNQREHAGAAK